MYFCQNDIGMSHRAIPSELKSLLADLKKGLVEVYGERLHQVVLFGSYARGDQQEESDVDVLVILNDDSVRGMSEINTLVDLSDALYWKYNKIVSAKAASLSRFNLKLPLYQNVREDGIPV
ncbi:nucleotidyltransferase domain-containing protein [Runella rosea]|uniref:Nucleotidyltransferase domain-containing protein n=2 Tax=Runella rosea TaxID=2259595 RepID=A0A344THK2_9BACT|nr:nucleotidyltransferase domain-containing protein [Runella rosea]